MRLSTKGKDSFFDTIASMEKLAEKYHFH